MLEYSRYRAAAGSCTSGSRPRPGSATAPRRCPRSFARVSLDVAKQSYEPVQLAEAIGGLLRMPPPLDLRHMARPHVTVEMRLSTCAGDPLDARAFSFDEAVKGADRLTEAMTVWALLELYKSGEAAWQQDENFGPITVDGAMNELARIVEALLFLSSEPLTVAELADACEVGEGEVVEALARLREHYAEGWRGVVLREVAGGFTLATDPVAERAARRLLARPRTPPLTQAQAECLAIVAYLQPVSRPEIARIRGVASESAVGTLLERGLIQESGRSAVRRRPLPHERPVREALRPRGPRRAAGRRGVRPEPGGGGHAARPAPEGRRAARRAGAAGLIAELRPAKRHARALARVSRARAAR